MRQWIFCVKCIISAASVNIFQISMKILKYMMTKLDIKLNINLCFQTSCTFLEINFLRKRIKVENLYRFSLNVACVIGVWDHCLNE